MSSKPKFIPTTHFPFFTPYQKNTHHLVVVALLRSITMIEQKDDHGIGWNAECGLCVQVFREQALLTSAPPQPCPPFCRVATQPRVGCFQNTETLDAAYKHRQETKLALVRFGQVCLGLVSLGQPWSGLVRLCVACSLHPAVWILTSRKNEASVLTNTALHTVLVSVNKH